VFNGATIEREEEGGVKAKNARIETVIYRFNIIPVLPLNANWH